MTKLIEKEEVLRLRKLGKSYREIKEVVHVSKGTLSLWLHDHPLSSKKISELRDWSERRIEHYKETRQRTREALFDEIYKNQKKSILPLSPRDMFIAGLFLYWGEGSKTKLSQLCLSNSHPAVIKAYIAWLQSTLSVEKRMVKIKLHLYSDMDIKKETIFWAQAINVPLEQFKRPYIKVSKFASLTYKSGFGHGTCNAMIGNVIVGRKIFAGLKVIEDYFNGPVA